MNNSTAHDEVLLELIAEAVNNSAKNKGKAVISDVGQISDVDLCLFCAEPCIKVKKINRSAKLKRLIYSINVIGNTF